MPQFLFYGVLCCIIVSTVVGNINVVPTVPTNEEDAAAAVLKRVVPRFASRFRFQKMRHNKFLTNSSSLPHVSKDIYRVVVKNGTATVSGTSGVGMTAGAYQYIKTQQGGQVTWGENGTGNQLELEGGQWPDYDSGYVTSNVPIRYGWNMCTFSYSATWWSPQRWQREIDWMALHGVNFPLAVTGQEYIWLEVFEDYNVSLDELQSWFSGPAFLTWQRMGNIRGFGGPLPRDWIIRQKELNIFILRQMRALGMRPILSCFAGHVPQVVQRIFPNAKITQSPGWNGFPSNETDVFFLDPTDPAYQELGAAFIEKQSIFYGTDNYYSCDTFNEVDPTSADPDFLQASAKAVVDSIRAIDPTGVWVMQSWLFKFGFWTKDRVRAYLSGAPLGSLLVLDLESLQQVLAPRFDDYFGHPWVWNLLHNFGGVRGMYGYLDGLAVQPYSFLNTSGMIGIGFTPEAIEHNPIMFELLTDTFFLPGPVKREEWMQQYVAQRYSRGKKNLELQTTWQTLYTAVYNQKNNGIRTELEWTPTWTRDQFGWCNGDPDLMHKSLLQLLDAIDKKPSLAAVGPLQYDLVDIARQATTMFFSDVHRQFVNAMFLNQYSDRYSGRRSVIALSELMMKIITTLDNLLGSNPNYLLGLWTTDATNWAQTADDRDIYLYNAKNQITLWGPQPGGAIIDYACKAWAGLYQDYYHGRWGIFFKGCIEAALSGGTYNESEVQDKIDEFELEWVESDHNYPNQVNGHDAVDVAKTLRQFMDGSEHLQYNYKAMPKASFTGPSSPRVMWSRDPARLALLCDMMDECVGFSGGVMYLKGSEAHDGGWSTIYVKWKSLSTGDVHQT